MAPALLAIEGSVTEPESNALDQFRHVVSPILEERCYDCHGDGARKGGLAFDALTTREQILQKPEIWLKVLRNIRSHVMPPPEKSALSGPEQLALEQWIVSGAFGLDSSRPDPGRITVRRLNRAEYRNTLRDLIGADFDADAMLPPDDVGYGFDNIGDVLSISPMRMEKFIEAAIAAVNQGEVPLDTVALSVKKTLGSEFLTTDGLQTAERYSFYRPQKTSHLFNVKAAGDYRISLNTKIDGEARPVDPQQARVSWTSDGTEFFGAEYKWADAEYLEETRTLHWEPGEHEVSVSIAPVFPELQPLRTKMEYRVLWVTLEGPLDKSQWDHHPNYKRFYLRDKPPESPEERRIYAREVLARFVAKAYRRDVAPQVIDQLAEVAEKAYSIPGATFEKGIAQAIIAVLASPRFLFHIEQAEPALSGEPFAQVDQYTLASRLSYALWSSMPDEELTQLATRGELRKNFRSQVQRMLADPKSQAFAENFSGQWLQSRGVLDIPINSTVVMAGETPVAVAAAAPPTAPEAGSPPGRGFARRPRVAPGTLLTPEIRVAMKKETDAYFDYVVREDRSVLELLESNYTFVNAQLAPVYGIDGIAGLEMRRVELPAGSVRGGVLTMGSVLTVTSNPTRTSPVKRGKWILENILGSPPAPPPPNIPALEDSKAEGELKAPTQRELLALHRADPKCASCHSRMDPPGLAMENFNAFGRLRTQEFGEPINPSGELVTGEKFSGVRDLKRALIEKHRLEFYRTITEKLLTYVLGRGVEYYDVPTVDSIVEGLDKDNGRFSTLLFGVLESAAFQKRRLTPNPPSQDARTVALPASSNDLP